MIRVIAAGSTTVQDLGRPGQVAVGVPESGALDPAALRRANRLVGNHEHAAGLETVLGGLVLETAAGRWVALAGAGSLTVRPHRTRGRAHPASVAVWVPPGARIEVDAPHIGLRSWLAVRGGFDAPLVLGSASTDLLCGIGAPLVDGDRIRVGTAIAGPLPPVDIAPQPSPSDDMLVLRAVPGPRDDWFIPASLASLTRERPVESRSNRIGVRLGGEPVLRRPERADVELPSEGTVAGSVQIAANGLPVLFLADHPVTGGYPVAATVVAADLPLAAQARPGQSVRLRFVRSPLARGPA